MTAQKTGNIQAKLEISETPGLFGEQLNEAIKYKINEMTRNDRIV